MKIRVSLCVTTVLFSVLTALTGCSSGSSSSTTPTPAVIPPTVSSVAPASLTAGAAATIVTVSGSNFTADTAVQIGGQLEVTSYVSATQLTATIPAAQLAAGSSLSVIAENSSGSSATGTPVTLTVNNVVPAISQLVPATLFTAAGSTVVAVAGTGFVPATVVDVNGSPRTTTFVSTTQINVVLTSADLAVPGSLSLTAVNPAPGGGTSAAAAAAVNNPAPGSTITLSPATVLTSATAPVTVTVTGTNFIPSSTVQVNTVARATTFVSATQLTFQLTAADIATATTLNINVSTPTPGGGASLYRALVVSAPTPTPVISTLAPSQFIVNSSAATLNVIGTNLTLNCTVQWNGSALTTIGLFSFNGSYTLSATVPASLLTATGTAAVTVSCPTASPAVSNSLNVTIANPPAPTLTSISPSIGPVSTAQTITLYGTNFFTTTTASLNGTSLPTTYVSSTQVTVAVPASAIAIPGSYNFTVTTPSPGGGTSSAAAFTAYVALVNSSMIYNSANGLFYLSIPGAAGAPYGNSIVSVDPATGALGKPIFVGTDPNKMALSTDGTILWVGLDGASAVRQVNLTTGTAGLQFTLGGNGGLYDSPATAYALAALPGSPNSVVVATELSSTYQSVLAIYDSGVLRGTATNAGVITEYYALQANGTTGEIYAGGSTYVTYTYGPSGLTQKAKTSSTNTFAGYSVDEMQIANGIVYTDFGQASDAESGALLGTFYSSSTNVASGSVVADTALGSVFVLEGSTYTSTGSTPTQIQVFNLNNYTATGNAIPVNYTTSSNTVYTPGSVSSGPNRLTRWGANGLAYRTNAGFYSLRSNFVKNLSATSADLAVAITAPATSATGTNSTYTATVTNNGPSPSTSIAFNAALPSNGVLVSATPSAGTCSTGSVVTCDLGGLANGGTATVALVFEQLTAGSSPLTVQVTGSENDPTPANNSASASVTVTGSTYNVVPVIGSISPAAIQAGSSATTIVVTGTGFASGATVQLGATALTTSFTNSTTLTATVPSSAVTTQGWSPITVSNPSPGGGTSNVSPLTVFSVITLGVNHILYDPFSRNIMASVGSGSSTVTGNSIAAINPFTATVGTPVAIGSQPTNLSLTSDGQILYTILSGSQSVARFNMLTQQADFTVAIPNNSSFAGGVALRGIAAQPGTENTIALDIASFSGNAIYDFNPTAKTAAIRGQASGPYSGSCIAFLDTADLFAFDTDTSGATFDHYTVTSAGFTYYNYSQYSESTLDGFGCFKLSGGLAFGNGGGVANPATVPATQLGIFTVSGGGEFSTSLSFVPDTSLQRAYFLTSGSTTYGSNPSTISVFDQNTYLPTTTLPINFAAIEGTSTSFSAVDMVRWGQDGLAILTSGGHLYLLNGPVVAPQELNTNTAATLSSSSTSTITHGSGNVLLTLTGSNFIPGVAVTWNGSYRTTTIVDATHVTVAIPASDLAAAGTGSLVATNPGATASSGLTVTIN